MRAVLVANPGAGMRGRPDDLREARGILESAGWQLDVVESSEEREGARVEEIARRAVAEGYGSLLVAGGDGTVQAAGRVLLGGRIPLGILPFGRAMNIARGLGIPMDHREAARTIALGHVRGADVGEVAGEVFFEVAGVGLDAELFAAARAAERGRWRGAWRRLGRWATQTTHRIRVRGEHEEVVERAMQVLVLNSPFYAWSFPVTAGDMHDGLLDVAVFPRMGRRDLIRSLVRIWREGQHEVPPIVVREASVRIESDAALPIHADGRLVGTLPATFTCRAGALPVYTPRPTDA